MQKEDQKENDYKNKKRKSCIRDTAENIENLQANNI